MYDTVETKPGTSSVEGELIPDGAQGVIMEFTEPKGGFGGTAALVEFDLAENPGLTCWVQIIKVQFLSVVS